MKIESIGHRGRLKEKFLRNGFEGFLDYEVIELLLILGTPRKDCKQIAKNIVSKYKSVSKALNSSIDELTKIPGIGENNSIAFKVFQELQKLHAKESIQEVSQLSSPPKIFDYLRHRIGSKKQEYFTVLCLDIRNKLIVEESTIGTLSASLVHPREVFKIAIQNSSSSIVVAHNHPSGDVEPSEADISTTKRLVDAGKLLGISIIDHLIISTDRYYSFKENNLF
jgi:DNA repair protein RadC